MRYTEHPMIMIIFNQKCSLITQHTTRSRSLALRLSSSVIREATRVWVPSRVIRVACHPTWGYSGVRKEDPGQT